MDHDPVTPQAQTAYSSGSASVRHSCERVLRLCALALQEIPNLAVLDEAIQDDPNEMVHLEVVATGSQSPASIQADLKSLWRRSIAPATPSLHHFRTTAVGFEFRFTVIDNGTCVSGAISITVSDPPLDSAIVLGHGV